KEAGVARGGSQSPSPVAAAHARGEQPVKALTGDTRIGILQWADDPPYPGGDQRVGAGRGPPPVAAGLEADIGSSSPSGVAGSAQRSGFAMRPSSSMCPASPYHPAAH